MKELEYPFDGEYILKKKKSIKKELQNDETPRIPKKIAILGGSTTADIAQILDLFLLQYGIEASFYESEYNKYYEDALFGNPDFDAFEADVIYIHTGIHNIMTFPEMTDTDKQINTKLEAEFSRFLAVWEKCAEKKNCVIIQNNFEYPSWRLLGNKDASDPHGKAPYAHKAATPYPVRPG